MYSYSLDEIQSRCQIDFSSDSFSPIDDPWVKPGLCSTCDADQLQCTRVYGDWMEFQRVMVFNLRPPNVDAIQL